MTNSVVVCGASKGIGLACARAFMGVGLRVFRIGRDRLNLENSRAFVVGNQEEIESSLLVDISADLSSESQARKAASKVLLSGASLCHVVVCVGSGEGSRDSVPTAQDFVVSRERNWTPVENSVRAFVPLLRDKTNASLALISSVAGIESIDAPIPYSVDKAALVAFSKKLSVSLAPGIRVNCVAPGNIYTEHGVWGKRMKADPAGVQSMLDQSVPLRRLGTPEDVANAVLFLTSDQASFITGSCLVVDGGQTRFLGDPS